MSHIRLSDDTHIRRDSPVNLAQFGKMHSVSARNSTYWLKKVQEQKHDKVTSLLPTRDFFTEVIYENQRYHMLIGWGSIGHLLPIDPKKFSSDQTQAVFKTFPKVSLPESTPQGSWEWLTPWQIDYDTHPCDSNGWSYGSSFASLRAGYMFPDWQSNKFVRRRRWIRKRHFISEGLLRTCDAFDDTYLDSLSGYLNKQGHIRKNWKRRFFVLDESTLRYYKDDTKSRLKGEVLLFQQSIHVKYVDSEVSGRDYTFSIESNDYSLLLQASSAEDREGWIYAIEDAILCRDSYSDDQVAKRNREKVVRRRAISADLLKQQFVHVSPVLLSPDTKGYEDSVYSILEPYLDKEACEQFLHTFETQFRPQLLSQAAQKPQQRLFRAMKFYRDFVDGIVSRAIENYDTEITKSEMTDNENLDGWVMCVQDAIIEELERIIFIPLQDTVNRLIADAIHEEKLASFNSHVQWLVTQPMDVFEIDTQHSSATWTDAIKILNTIDEYPLPSSKLDIIVKAAKCIYSTCEDDNSKSSKSIGADDFLPIFIYVICHSSLQNVLYSRQLVIDTMLPSISFGEKAYYATMLEAAVEYLCSYDPLDHAASNSVDTEISDLMKDLVDQVVFATSIPVATC